jgi:hypothetical protein
MTPAGNEYTQQRYSEYDDGDRDRHHQQVSSHPSSYREESPLYYAEDAHAQQYSQPDAAAHALRRRVISSLLAASTHQRAHRRAHSTCAPRKYGCEARHMSMRRDSRRDWR